MTIVYKSQYAYEHTTARPRAEWTTSTPTCRISKKGPCPQVPVTLLLVYCIIYFGNHGNYGNGEERRIFGIWDSTTPLQPIEPGTTGVEGGDPICMSSTNYALGHVYCWI